MSSPLALERKSASRRAFVSAHRKLSHDHRIGALAERIAAEIEACVGSSRARCLDVGCGDMTLAEALEKRKALTEWRCIDVHALPRELAGDPRWRKYTRFDGAAIPYADRSFDVALFCDVLHHAPRSAAHLLAEAGRVARHVIVKDHFEYGRYSRSMLRLMDFVGNWGYGIEVPRRYFTRQSFGELAAASSLAVVALDCGMQLYAHLPLVRTLLRPEWHFIARLQRA